MRIRPLSLSVLCFAIVSLWPAAMLQAQSGLTIPTSSTLPVGSVGASYSTNVSVTGGVPPYGWYVLGSLPPGLRLSAQNATGTILGTPTAVGTYSFSLFVADSVNSTISKAFSLSIQTSFLISTSSPLPSASAGQSYSEPLATFGGTGPFQWTAGTGLPSGLTLDANSGIISGTPNTPGSYSFSVQVTDTNTNKTASATFALTVTPAALQITTAPPLFNGQIGLVYSQVFSAAGGFPPYTWSLGSGNAGGLTLNSTSGILSGTPQAAGTLTFVVKVTDTAGITVSATFSVTVNPPSLVVTTGSPLPSGTAGVPYDQVVSVTASGGTPPYTWSLVNGTVPGLTLNASTVELSGTPNTPGTFSFTLQVTDSTGLVATRNFSLTISPAALSLTTNRQLTSASLNVPFAETVSAAGGSPPYTWSANGLPAGLTINAGTGAVSGTPTSAGTFTPVITVTDSALNFARDNFTLVVQLPTPPPLTISGLPNTAGAAQQFPLQVSISSTYPAAMQGQLILTFQPNSGPGDSTIQFSTGGRIVSFNIPLGSTAATFLDNNGLAISQLQIQTGTAAGTIVISLSNLTAAGVGITPTPAPSVTTQIATAAPVIASTLVVRNADTATGCKQGQICLQVTGYSTAREVTQATFTFTAASGQTLLSSASSISVDVSSLFSGWFSSSTMGGQFIFVQPFTVTGDPTAVLAASVTLTNRTGSTTATVNQ